VTERRRRPQQQLAGVSGAVRDGLAVTGGGLRTSQQGGFTVSVSAFGFSLSLSLTLCLSIQLFRKIWDFFVLFRHAARTPHAVSFGFFFFFFFLKNKFH
jgi:hypothetical protein